MFYFTEYPKVYSNSQIVLDILTKPVVWFRPFLTALGQLFLYRLKIRPIELLSADLLLKKTIIKMKDGTEVMIGVSSPSSKPTAVVLYLHTVCGNYTQLSHIAHMLKQDNIAYVTYTRGGNDSSLNFNKFNFVGRIEELQVVIRYIHQLYPSIPIHAIGASAGSALLIRYLGKYNTKRLIASAVLVSPGYDFMRSFKGMNSVSKAYLVNKMKYMIRDLPCKDKLKSIRSLDDWINFQSQLLGYKNLDDYVSECDPVNYLDKINVPTLFLSALDDSVFSGKITQEYLHLPRINPNVIIVTTERGGHVIFEDEGHEMPWFLRVTHEWLRNRIVF